MSGGAHMAIGLMTGALLAVGAGVPSPVSITAAVVCAFAALLPDIDHPQSIIGRRVWMIARPLSLVTTHRGITHSLAALAVVSIAAAFVLPMPIALLIGAGYASHLAADALTRRGVPFFAPLSWRMVSLARIAPAGAFERLIAMGALTVALGVIARYSPAATPQTIESMRADVAAWIARLPTAIPLGIDLRLK